MKLRKHQYRSEGGQGMVEYALIIGLIAIIVIVIMLTLFPDIRDLYTGTESTVGSYGEYQATTSETMY